MRKILTFIFVLGMFVFLSQTVNAAIAEFGSSRCPFSNHPDDQKTGHSFKSSVFMLDREINTIRLQVEDISFEIYQMNDIPDYILTRHISSSLA